MLAIHQNGTRITSRNTHQPDRGQDLARAHLAAAPAQEVAADQGDADHEERHQEDRDRHPAPPAELVEGDLVGVGGEHLGGRARPAAGHHVDDVEVVDGQDEAEQRRHDDDVLEPGQGDVPEAPPGARPVHRGRLVDARAGCSPCPARKDTPKNGKAPPPVGDDHGHHGALGRGHEGDGPAEEPRVEQHAVEEAAAGEGVEHPAPGERDDDGGGDPRQEEEPAEEVAPADRRC